MALGVSVLALALSVPPGSLAGDQGPNVTVTNTPLPVQGTVNVGNFPATQPVSGAVSITGTPSVHVTAATPLPTQPVGGGAATQVGQPASSLINLFCNPSCNELLPGGGGTDVVYAVPSGKALIITDVQWTFQVLGVHGPTSVVQIFGPGGFVAFFPSPVDASGGTSGQVHLATGLVFLPGQAPTLGPGQQAGMQGYLVPNQ